MEIIPLELRLNALGYLRLLFFKVKIIDITIWSIKLFPFRANLVTIYKEAGKPTIVTTPSMNFKFYEMRYGRNADNELCSVLQVPNRAPSNPAFIISTRLSSSLGEIDLWFSVGSYSGGRDVMNWSKLTKSSLLVPANLITGVPLYWTVKATTTGGQSQLTQCKLRTYDTTIPDGRIDASYKYTSHPNALSGKIVAFDDSNLDVSHLHSVGFTKGFIGSNVKSWQIFNFSKTVEIRRTDNPLKQFNLGKQGKLIALPIYKSTTDDEQRCAQECIEHGDKCISFDYEFHTESCELHKVIEGPNADIRISGTFKHYERVDLSNTYIIQQTLDLKHGNVYYLNAEIKNILQYKNVIASDGTMVDFTPPEPVNVGKTSRDVLAVDRCNASIIQRCEDVTWKENHRKIIDGKGANTVFNGHQPGKETLYTLTNHFASCNWVPFVDKESGIFGYTWAVGIKMCSSDISKFRDPHEHLSDKKFWTYTGYARNIHLQDGKYFVSVQAVNNVVHGGALVTTVCHSTPIVIDTTPPVFEGVSDIVFDEDFNMMAIYFKADDKESLLSRIDFGLGKTKHDVEVRGYSPFPYPKRQDPFLIINDLNITTGEPAWIRLRAVNNVELFKTGHSDDPILIDRTNPQAGKVLDGEGMDNDVTYQSDDTQICASWKGFYDPESGIKEYRWGVGTSPGHDDILPMQTFGRSVKDACASIPLSHNTSYYSTVEAKNSALNSKTVKSSSDGVLVDTTLPVAGWIVDGKNPYEDMSFSSETALVSARWGSFSDQESGISRYVVDVIVNDEFIQKFEVGKSLSFDDYSMSFSQGDKIMTNLTAYNGAGLSTSVKSNGFVIDATPPLIKYISDNKDGVKYQSDTNGLQMQWKFVDPESGIKIYRYTVFESYGGAKNQFYPLNGHFITTKTNTIKLKNLHLINGHQYSVQVVALNNADMPSSYESEGVMIDNTHPRVTKIHIGLLDVPEEIEDGKIMHADQTSVTVSWVASDFESGIEKVFIAIGTSENDTSVTGGYNEFSEKSCVTIKGLDLKPSSMTSGFSNKKTYYYVSIRVQNGAGLMSDLIVSKPLNVLRANVPGNVYDGRVSLSDADFTIDKTSIAMSFEGFESEACNIVQYEWAIGYRPFMYDVLQFTGYGIVMQNESVGQAQIHLRLYEDSTYYITVRAKTGYNCPTGEYILACSDGIKLDTTPPKIRIQTFEGKNIAEKVLVLFQSNMDSVDISWNIHDSSEIVESWWSIGTLPGVHDLFKKRPTTTNFIPAGEVTLAHGQTFFVNIGATDGGGNENSISSPSITVDTTPAMIKAFTCTPYISHRRSLITCKWEMLQEWESKVTQFSIGIGTNETNADISNFHALSLLSRRWTRDLRMKLETKPYKRLYVSLKLINAVGFQSIQSHAIIVDHSPPTGGTIQIITSVETDKKQNRNNQLCQIPTSFIEMVVSNWTDPESEMARYQIAVGSEGKAEDILPFTEWDITGTILIADLNMVEGSEVRVTVRAFNKAGLYAQTISRPIVISQNPTLRVIDGPYDIDMNYQSSLSSLEGHWEYSDGCPIVSVEWSIESIDGNVIQSPTIMPSALHHFYSDLVSLSNGVTYINIIKTIDFLNRVRINKSNGITVKIQPPSPGSVRDGSGNDINYQESIHVLSANWNRFGKSGSKDPTENIVRYEVAIGDDVRFERTKSNVHFFVDVGLNTSHVFSGLNLTSKSVTYYLTVRAYSKAGSYQDGYSNGIKVGYKEILIPGTVEHNKIQHNTVSLSISWTGFEADMGIDHFEVGLSSLKPELPNGTQPCDVFQKYEDIFTVHALTNVGRDTFHEMTNLNLKHNHTYYVTVIASDITEKCIGVTGNPLVIDTTPPESGQINVTGYIGDNIMYVQNNDHVEVVWETFVDRESTVSHYEVNLFSTLTCFDSGILPSNKPDEYHLERTGEVSSDNRITFYELSLLQTFTYIVSVTAFNEAGLQTTSASKHIKVDATPPLIGKVNAGDDWFKDISFQPYVDRYHGVLAIGRTKSVYECKNQRLVFPGSGNELLSLTGRFSEECVQYEDSSINVEIRHDDNLRGIIKGGVETKRKRLLSGNYTFVMKSAKGKEIVSTIYIGSGHENIHEDFEFIAQDSGNVSDFEIPKYGNMSTFGPGIEDVETFDKNSTLNEKNHTKKTAKSINQRITALGASNKFGAGIHIPGFKVDEKRFIFVWVYDEFKTTSKQIQTDFDPTLTSNEYVLKLTNTTFAGKFIWNIHFFINGDSIAEFSGLQFQETGTIGMYNWNKDDYVPPILDINFPEAFSAKAVITSIKIPLSQKKPCVFGKPFYDAESGIKEIWAKVSEFQNDTDTSLQGYTLFKTFCNICVDGCNIGCHPSCQDVNSDFELLHIEVKNLSLQEASLSGDRTNASSTHFDSKTYFLNAIAVNSAGLKSAAFSNGIMVDSTPPEFKYVRCTNPLSSTDEPTLYQGTNDSISANWDCSEDVGEIEKYFIRVGASPGQEDILQKRPIGLVRKFKTFQLAKPLEHQHTYFVTVTAYNSAGLSSESTCNITVEVLAPDVQSLTLSNMFADLDDEEADVSAKSEEIGLSWTNGTDDVEFYEWEIGSVENGDDIFPRVKVGLQDSKKAAIKNGELWIDDISSNASVGVFASRNQTNSSTVPASHGDNSFFNLEPGICVHITLYAVGRSHLSNSRNAKPLCIKRTGDFDIDFSSRQSMTVLDPKSSAEIVTLTCANCKLFVGVLDEDNVKADYGTAASAKYLRYIVDPLTTQNNTERRLRRRFIGRNGAMFYITPTKLDSAVQIHVPFKTADYDPNTEEPLLIVWNKEKNEWEDINSVCKSNSSVDFTTGTIIVEVCQNMFETFGEKPKNLIKRRSANPLSSVPRKLNPRMFTSRKASSGISNTPPIILTQNITVFEDSESLSKIEVDNADDDPISIEIIKAPLHGSAAIKDDNKIFYKPNRDFSGNDNITLLVRENKTNVVRKPLHTEKVIYLKIVNINDEPELSFKRHFKNIKSTRNNLTMEVLLNGNVTQTLHYGDLIVDDIDTRFNVSVGRLLNNSLQSSFSFIERKMYKHTTEHPGTHLEYEILHTVDKTFSGYAKFAARAHDVFDDGKISYSKELQINVYVLINPCVHGACLNKSSTVCMHKSRAFSYEDYQCDCLTGYEGTWCEIEINECIPNPCSVFFDCDDLIGTYQCNLNGGKTFGLAVGFGFIILTSIFLIRRYIQRQKPSNKVRDSYTWDKSQQPNNAATPKNVQVALAMQTRKVPDLVKKETFREKLFYRREDIDDALKPLTSYTAQVGMVQPPHLGKQMKMKLEK